MQADAGFTCSEHCSSASPLRIEVGYLYYIMILYYDLLYDGI